jgi:hypothetical protein
VYAGKYNCIYKQPNHTGKIKTNGIIIKIPKIKSIEEWAEYHGAKIARNIIYVYKAVRDNYDSAHGLSYKPGTKPKADDWDGGKAECGGGLHFCASIGACRGFDSEATRFLLCAIKLKDIRKPREDDEYQNKIKARCVCKPLIEVDRFGELIKEATK